jgi:hypothetical protein
MPAAAVGFGALAVGGVGAPIADGVGALPGTFGAAPQATGGFGAAAGGFGAAAPAGAGAFGAAAPDAFGAPAAGGAAYHYQPTMDLLGVGDRRRKGDKNPQIVSVSAMPQFRQPAKSHEEIRLEDMVRTGVVGGAAPTPPDAAAPAPGAPVVKTGYAVPIPISTPQG